MNTLENPNLLKEKKSLQGYYYIYITCILLIFAQKHRLWVRFKIASSKRF